MSGDSDPGAKKAADPSGVDESLRRSEELFHLIVEGVKDYAIFMLDPEGRIISWNAGAEKIKGYTAREVIGRHFSCFYTPEDIARRWPYRELEIARAQGRVEDEGWRIRKDGTRFWANIIITALYDATGRLRGFAKITRDMTERKRIEALEEADRLMNEFLAMLSHELRNPLAPIRNAVGLMRLRDVADPALHWAQDVIERQVATLSRLIDDLLDVSRITSGKISLHEGALNLADAVTGALEVSRPLIESRRQVLEVTLPPEPLQVRGDLTRLSQVVLNLLNNAAKFTPERGHIWVCIERDGDQAVLRVRDDGEGMSPALLPKIFDLFAQGDRTLDRSQGGLGIGLTIVRRLVQMHRGSVEARSQGVGRGSEFVVRLPRLAAPPSGGAMPGGRDGGAPAPRSRRVLVVDDNVDAAESLAMLLRVWGHEVETAHDGPSALRAAAASHPEVLLLDIGLPGMNGFELAMQLRDLPGVAEATLIAMTGYGHDQHRRRGLKTGFDHHLVKPVEPEKLRTLLASLASAAFRSPGSA